EVQRSTGTSARLGQRKDGHARHERAEQHEHRKHRGPGHRLSAPASTAANGAPTPSNSSSGTAVKPRAIAATESANAIHSIVPGTRRGGRARTPFVKAGPTTRNT